MTIVRLSPRHSRVRPVVSRARRIGGLLFFALSCAGVGSPALAQDSRIVVPVRDDAIVEQLPAHLGSAVERRASRAAERAQRVALQQHPDELGLALQSAQDALQRGRLRGDPRELGTVEAALAPWWSLPDPPAAVRLMRATVHQSQHEFALALTDLDVLVTPQTPPAVRAQAELTRSAVHQVLGHYGEAEAGCRRLAGPDYVSFGSGVRMSALACLAELSSLQGHPDTAAASLARLAGAPDASSATTAAGEAAPGWLSLMRAELAERRGDDAAGALYAAALAANPDVYTRCAYADWLLDRHRADEAVKILQGHEDADPVLLRLALAYRQLHGANATLTRSATRMLGDRYDAALLRGDRTHGREQSRYELDLHGQPARALALARTNWQVQREPADAVVLVRAARGDHRPDAAAPVWTFLHDTGGEDARIGPSPAASVAPVAPPIKTSMTGDPS